MANSNRGNNSIGSLRIEGVLTSDQEVIDNGIIKFDKNLYMEDRVHSPHLDFS